MSILYAAPTLLRREFQTVFTPDTDVLTSQYEPRVGLCVVILAVMCICPKEQFLHLCAKNAENLLVEINRLVCGKWTILIHNRKPGIVNILRDFTRSVALLAFDTFDAFSLQVSKNVPCHQL